MNSFPEKQVRFGGCGPGVSRAAFACQWQKPSPQTPTRLRVSLATKSCKPKGEKRRLAEAAISTAPAAIVGRVVRKLVAAAPSWWPLRAARHHHCRPPATVRSRSSPLPSRRCIRMNVPSALMPCPGLGIFRPFRQLFFFQFLHFTLLPLSFSVYRTILPFFFSKSHFSCVALSSFSSSKIHSWLLRHNVNSRCS